ncbi:DNA polymerase III subunit delta [uncultured Thomasclavelia sp.]|uniref:DNA polymerase III subunit delta n=1 Tax=uncultured Thomasclavelia sp. TaxID=3025759 RepID=UPI0025E21165|nr:DNA polymerase III subunit delta [uncultured Thomasclavelia sp.]
MYVIILIYGQERFLIEQKLTALKQQYHCSDENMNLSIFRGDEDLMQDVYEDLITPPFFTDNKMVILKNPVFLTTKKVKKDAEQLKYFQKCLDECQETVFVIYYHGDDFDKRKKIVKQLLQQAEVFKYDKVNHYRLSDSTRKAVKRREAVIDDDALELLLSRCDESLERVANEVEKLCLYSKHITYQVVDKLVNKPLDENIFDLTNAILSKNRQKIFSIYHDLMILNEEPIKLIVSIANQMRLHYQVKLLDRKGYTDQEIGKILGVNPYRLKYVRQEGKNFQLDELIQSIDQLSKLDVKIKSGKLDKKVGLELFLIRI